MKYKNRGFNQEHKQAYLWSLFPFRNRNLAKGIKQKFLWDGFHYGQNVLFSNLLHLLSFILCFTGKVSKRNRRPLGPNLSSLSPNLTSSFSRIPAGLLPAPRPRCRVPTGSAPSLPLRLGFYFSEQLTALLHLQTMASWPDSGQNKTSLTEGNYKICQLKSSPKPPRAAFPFIPSDSRQALQDGNKDKHVGDCFLLLRPNPSADHLLGEILSTQC